VQARLEASEEKHQRLQETFASLSRQALDANTAHLVQLAEQVVRRAQESSQAELDRRARAVEEMVRPVKESLGRVDEKIGKLEKAGDVSAARLAEQVRALAVQEEKLRGETAKLASALRAPAQRGRWGETQLRRTLELAGLRAHVDFDEQPVAQLADGVLRPDVAVRLPGGKTVLLDAKVPLEELGSLMGHSRIETTMRYAHLYDETKREAANKVGSLLAGLLPSKPKRPAKRKLKVVAGGKR